jgi:hypothetical protein
MMAGFAIASVLITSSDADVRLAADWQHHP